MADGTIDGAAPPAVQARRGPGRPRDASVERRVLEAALTLSTLRGFDGWSVEELAEQAGVAKSTIFRRWGAKGKVLVAAFEQLLLSTIELPDTGSIRDDLMALVRAQVQLYDTQQGRSVIRFALDTLDAAGGNTEVAAAVRRTAVERRAMYERVVARGQERGELRPDVHPALAVDLVFGAMWGRLFGLGQLGDPDEFAAAAVDAAVTGLGVPPAATR